MAFEPRTSVSSIIVPAQRGRCVSTGYKKRGYIDIIDLPSREVDFKLLCNKYSAF